MEATNRKFDLEERLIEFAIAISDIVEILPGTKLGNQIAGQLIRSGTSPAVLRREQAGRMRIWGRKES